MSARREPAVAYGELVRKLADDRNLPGRETMHDPAGVIAAVPSLVHVIADETAHGRHGTGGRRGRLEQLFVSVGPVLAGFGIRRRQDVRARARQVVHQNALAGRIEIEFIARKTVKLVRFW